MSLFIAIPAPEALQDQLATYSSEVARIAPEASIVPARNWHVTLAYLGQDTSQDAVYRATSALAELDARDFPFDVAGIGIFPNQGRDVGRCIVWARVEDVPGLRDCHRMILGHLKHQGFNLGHEAFRPHLTLARRATVAHGAELSELEFEKPSFHAPAERVCLMKTEPYEDGGVCYPELYTKGLVG